MLRKSTLRNLISSAFPAPDAVWQIDRHLTYTQFSLKVFASLYPLRVCPIDTHIPEETETIVLRLSGNAPFTCPASEMSASVQPAKGAFISKFQRRKSCDKNRRSKERCRCARLVRLSTPNRPISVIEMHPINSHHIKRFPLQHRQHHVSRRLHRHANYAD